MAPTRKSRSVNKRFSNSNEVSPDKDSSNSNKSRQRKRKMYDMLGSQWSKGELQRFYEAYRKFGKDWKKVASVVRNRSIEMVEALYNMNRAYLSLPEGTASVVGLIAMMTDHYNVLEESESGGEGNGAAGSTQKFKKRGRGNVRLKMSKEVPLQSHSVASSDGCLSLLERRSSDGWAVGKRTPRFPVSYSHKKDGSEIYALPSKRGGKLEANASDEDDVAHVAALALTEASLRGSSPQALRTSHRLIDNLKPSTIHGRERMRAQSKITQGEPHVASTDEDIMEDSLGSKGAENGDFVRDSLSLVDIGVGKIEIRQVGKKIYGKKNKVEDISNDEFGESPEACSGTEGLDVSAAKGIVDIEITKAKFVRPSPPSQRKRSKKLYFGDESSAFDALQTLADLSLMMPTSTMEFDSSVAVKEDKSASDIANKFSLGEAISSSHPGEKTKISGATDKVNSFSGISKLGRDSPIQMNALLEEEKLVPESTNKGCKRKRKSLASKALVEEDSKSLNKGKRSSQMSVLSKARPLEHSFSVIGKRTAGTDTAVSTVQVPTNIEVILPTKQRSRRKKDPRRISTQKDSKSLEKVIGGQLTAQDKALYLKEKLSSLSSYMLRRWCAFEWFYSSIDYPWFAKNEFVEYLYHVGLGHIPRLTRVEWGVIRSSLGKPRRFSERFLHEEKDKLKQYRESVRTHYTELRAGIKDGLPTDLARPLTVGQRVIALHPKTREVHDGSILTVDHDRCRVQFDRPEIGVEFVKDIDCMPSNPLEHMPEALRRQHIAANKFYMESKELKVNGQLNNERSIAFDPNERPKNAQDHSYISSTNHAMNTLMKQMKGETIHSNTHAQAAGTDSVHPQQAAHGEPCMVAQIQSKEADIRALSELTHSLNKKEALLMELRHANNELMENRNNGNIFLKDSEPFKKHYATILVQLKEASDKVSSNLVHLRQRNSYPGHSMPPWLKSLPVSSDSVGPPSSVDNSIFNSQDRGSNVVEIVKGSRIKAHAMVDAAVQALSSVKEGEDAFTRIGEALYSMNGCQFSSEAGVSVMRSSDQVNGSLGHENHLTTCTSEPLVTGHQSHLKSHNDVDRNELQIPSELITSCVATLLTIQTCTERQYPPGDVAQILDSAVRSLHPSCPQNLPIYREIQMCMGRIKTQILALIPT